MTHLTHIELILYIGKWGLATEQREAYAGHLQNCESCRTQFETLQQKLKSMSRNNRGECKLFQQHLLPWLHAELETDKIEVMEQHLDQCEHCQTLHRIINDLPIPEKINELAIEIPAQARTRIEDSVARALKKATAKFQVKATKEKLVRAMESAINRLVLTFCPIQPAFKFRGEDPDELTVIEHPGGDLILETGLKNATLKLCSIFEDFTSQRKTDENGEVIFKNLAEGDYIASVEGYQLKKIKVKRKLKRR